MFTYRHADDEGGADVSVLINVLVFVLDSALVLVLNLILVMFGLLTLLWVWLSLLWLALF